MDITSHEIMDSSPNEISLPEKLRLELGALVGQFLQFQLPNEQVLLRVANPVLPDQEAALVSGKLLPRLQAHLNVEVPDITLGCDPEFFILWRGGKVSAATYLPYEGQIGSDGELGELRPHYGRHENQVVQNLRNLVSRIPATLKRASWANRMPVDGKSFSYEAHSYLSNVAAGFHVHLGIPPEILNTKKDFNRATLNHLIRCLDWYVSVPCVPLEGNHPRRLGKGKYGRPGDYRTKNYTLEYRTPGGILLRSPTLARGLLGISLLVIETAVARIKEASKNFSTLNRLTEKDLYQVMPIPSSSKVISILTDTSLAPAEKNLGGIKEALSRMPTFQKHQVGVEEFFRVVENQEKPGPNLLSNWQE